MKLLIVTQAVDTQDPVLGFFVRWIEEFAKHAESIDVICLKLGKSDLPKNVRVHSLGKEHGAASRAVYALRFFKLIWRLRHDYDTVFVHMNEEYVLLGGLLWKMLGKKVVLWRNHKMGSWRTKLAIALADVVCATSPQAYVATSPKAVRMPIGIDTLLFTPPAVLPARNTILFLGRLDSVKKPDIFLQALALLADRGIAYKADLYGSPTDPQSPHVQEYAALAAPLVRGGTLDLFVAVPHSETPELYQSHAVYVNLTPSGSFDKTIGEAMAAGCLIVTANEAVRGIVPDAFIVGDSAPEVAAALERACTMSDAERIAVGEKQRAYILQEHSLPLLAKRLGVLFA